MFRKPLFVRLWRLLLHPSEEWQSLASLSPQPDPLRSFVLPLSLLCGAATLLGCLLQGGVAAASIVVEVCAVVASLLLTYALAAVVANILLVRMLHVGEDRSACQMLVAHSMAVCMVLTFITELFPQLILFRWILQFYIVYLLWEGTTRFLSLDDDDRMKFSVAVAALILLLSYLLETLITSVAHLAGI